MNDVVSDKRPAFLITVDTEGDGMWSRSSEVTTENARYLPRFQQLCEQFGLKPTYLTNYEMAEDRAFQELARDALSRETAEVGMHLHAWHSPPGEPLTANDYEAHPFLIDFPEDVIRQKVDYLTKLLSDTFGIAMVSHRAGRWAFNEVYARVLVDHGYEVDCSVTPHVTWQFLTGGIPGRGGSDYRGYPDTAYFVDPDDISRPGSGDLLEVPMTVFVRRQWLHRLAGRGLSDTRPVRKVLKKIAPVISLRPGRNLSDGHMQSVLESALADGRDHIEFMMHSSEIMPGGSPRFPDTESIEKLYARLETVFDLAGRHCEGMTLSEYRQRFMNVGQSTKSPASPVLS